MRFSIPVREAHQPHGRPSQPKFGKRLQSGKEVDFKVEQRVINVIRELRSQKMTLRQIGHTLTDLGIPTKCRGKGWHPEMVRRVLMAADGLAPSGTADLATPTQETAGQRSPPLSDFH